MFFFFALEFEELVGSSYYIFPIALHNPPMKTYCDHKLIIILQNF